MKVKVTFTADLGDPPINETNEEFFHDLKIELKDSLERETTLDFDSVFNIHITEA